MEYLKKCPSCGYKSPEAEYNCNKCKYFLGDVEPEAEPECSPAEEIAVEEESRETTFSSDPIESDNVNTSHQANSLRKTDCYVRPTMLSIEFAGDVYDVKSGMVMGKSDASSTAELQITGLPGHIHRSHCRFDFVDNKWQVTAIKNEEFTNPTYVNGGKILPNQSKAIQNGDRLSLCDITFQVRIIS